MTTENKIDQKIDRRHVLGLMGLGGVAVALAACGTPQTAAEKPSAASEPKPAPSSAKPSASASSESAGARLAQQSTEAPKLSASTQAASPVAETFSVTGCDPNQFRIIESNGALNVVYRTIVTDKSPMDFGLPEKVSTIPFPTAQQFDARPRWSAEEASRLENRNKHFILIPDENNWGPPAVGREEWGRQSWYWSPAIMKDTDNFIMNSYGWNGCFVMEKVDMAKDGVAAISLLITPKDPNNGKDYLSDARWGSGAGNAKKSVQDGADTAFFGDKGRAGTVIFAANPLTGEYIKDSGGRYKNVVVSENGDWGGVLDNSAQNMVAFIGKFMLKKDELDANQQFMVRIGNTSKGGQRRQMNLMDLRGLGAKAM